MISIELFLKRIRAREPSISSSVNEWLRRHEKTLGPRAPPPPPKPQKRPKTISTYLPATMINEMKEDANRHGRSLAASVEIAWMIAKSKIQKFPGAT